MTLFLLLASATLALAHGIHGKDAAFLQGTAGVPDERRLCSRQNEGRARVFGSFRTDEVKIPLGPDGEIEYKVKMQPGGTLVYSWTVNKGNVYYDFHGERPEDPKHALSYGEGTEAQAHGSLIAPFAGIHGWFFQNQEASR